MFLGFDSSNYTTSVAVYDSGVIKQSKKVLTVKDGERGLRQSDAVFQHTVNMPELINSLSYNDIKAVGVSTRPRNVELSYMPCFLVGKAVATSVAKTHNVPLFETSHQVGHILAALYSENMLSLVNDRFIAFHLSGGTTEALMVEPHKDEIIRAEIIAQSNDLKAGQAIDRAGVMMGLHFPCGKELDSLHTLSDRKFKIRPSMSGLNCSLSGVENQARRMYEAGESKADVAAFVLSYITETIDRMAQGIIKEYGDLPMVFSGGVSSNSMIRSVMKNKYGAYFAKPEFSLDNAAGVAVYAAIKLG